MKPATNLLAGLVVEIERLALLLDDAFAHDDDMVGHGHRLDLVVGHVDRGRMQPVVQRADFLAHVDAQRRIEVGQRLVEQERLRMADDGAAHGDALALATGKLPRIALRADATDRWWPRPPRPPSWLRPWRRRGCAGCRSGFPRRSYADRAHRTGKPWRRRACAAARCSSVRRQSSGRRSEMLSRPASERRSVDLPQPDGPTERHEGALGDRQVDILQGMEGAVVLVDAAELDLIGHLRAPEVRPDTMRRCKRTKMARIGVTYIVA